MSPRAALLAYWQGCRVQARAGELPHVQALELLQRAAAAEQWGRVHRWLPRLLRHGVAPGERVGSAVALAAWLRDQRRPLEAMTCLNLVPWTEMDANAWLLRGVVEHALDRLSDAQLSLARAMADPELQATAAYHLGELHRSLAQFDQAAGWFLTSLAADPGHRFSHNSLQFTRFSPGLLPRVIEHYRQLVLQVPELALPRQLLAHYLLQHGELGAATAESRLASRLELGIHAHALEPPEVTPTPPDFVIIGVAKGGTTSLLRALAHHPRIWGHPRKELHFFDQAHHLGEAWYSAQFPVFRPEAGILRGEATPSYFAEPEVAARVAAAMPQVRCILLLRDPLDRAFSWLQHLHRLEGLQGEPEALLRRELTCLEALEPEELGALDLVWTGALQGSCYDQPLQRWSGHFPPAQLLVLSSEQLFQDPARELHRVLSFLGVPEGLEPVLQAWRPLNVSPGLPVGVSPELKDQLTGFFSRHSARALSQASGYAVRAFS